MMKPDARPGITIQPQWSCLDIADLLNPKMKIKMNKEKIFGIIFCIGFYGVMMHPIMIIALAIGVWGVNKYGTEDYDV